jgi:protein-S-isoprenylcysteine O-methyltransferase Ste14
MPAVRSAFFPKSYADFVAKLRVPLGFVLVGLFLWTARPDPYSLMWGIPVACLGVFVRGWAAGHLRKDQTLTVSGPYAAVRNPLYVGTVIAAIGLIVAAQSRVVAVLFAVVFLLIYLPKIELEEQHLAGMFPQFADYQKRVPMLLPRFKARPRSAGRFSWAQYRFNREYEAGLGLLVGILYLLGRTFFS